MISAKMSLKLLEDGGYTVRIQGRKGSKEQTIRFFPFDIPFEPLENSVINFLNAAQSASSKPSAYVQKLEFDDGGPSRSEIESYVDNEASQSKRSPEVDSSCSSLFEPEAPNLISGIIDPISKELRRIREAEEKKKKSALAASGKGNRAFAQMLKQRNEPKKPAAAETSKKSGSSKTEKANDRKDKSPQKTKSTKVTNEGSSNVKTKTKIDSVSRPVIKPIPAKPNRTTFKPSTSLFKQKPKPGSLGKSAADSSGQVFKGINSRRNENTRVSTEQVSLSQFPITLTAPKNINIRKAKEPSPELTARAPKTKVPKEKKKKHRNRRLQRGDSASSSSSSEDEEEIQPPSLQAIRPQSQVLAPVKQLSQQQSKPSMPNLFAEPESREAEEEEQTEPPTLTSERDVIDGANNDKAEDRSHFAEDNDKGSSGSTTDESVHGSDNEENADVLSLCVSDDEFGF